MIRDRTTVVSTFLIFLLVLDTSVHFFSLLFAKRRHSHGHATSLGKESIQLQCNAMSSGNPQITPSNITRKLCDRVRALLSRLNIGGFYFGGWLTYPPNRQIKFPAKFSVYTVCSHYANIPYLSISWLRRFLVESPFEES